MSIICYSTKHKILAADTQRSSSHDCIEGYGAIKIAVGRSTEFNPDLIAGAAGVFSAVTKFLSWIKGDVGIPPTFETDEYLSYLKISYDAMNDREQVWFGEKTLIDMQDNDEPFFAEGTGSKVALGAMDMGASPIEAVEICKKRDVYCGGRTSFINLRELYKGVQYV